MKLHHNGGRMQWNVELSLKAPEGTSKNSGNTHSDTPRSKKGQSRKILLLPWGWFVYRRRKLARDTPEVLALEALGQELELELPKAQELGLSKPKESKLPEQKEPNLVHEIGDDGICKEMYSPLPGVEYVPTFAICEMGGETLATGHGVDGYSPTHGRTSGRALSFCEGDVERLDLHPMAKEAKRMRELQWLKIGCDMDASHGTGPVPRLSAVKRDKGARSMIPTLSAFKRDCQKEEKCMIFSPDERRALQVTGVRKSVKLTEIPKQDENTLMKENTGGVALSRSFIPSKSFSSRGKHLKAPSKTKDRHVSSQSSVEVTQEVVHQLLSSLNTNIKAAAGGNNSANSSKSSIVQSSSKDRTKSSEGDSKNEKSRNKRRKLDEKDGDEDDCSDTDSGRRRKSNEKPNPGESPQVKRLKCPYYQRCPEECRLASCRGQGFTEMAKLKDHLKRVHIQPLRCTRCWEEVEIYDEHFRQDIICSKRPEPDDRRISPLKLRELRFNRAPFTKDQSVEEKWAILYRILFPDEKVVPSPYEQNEISTHMERLLIISLEEEIVKELGDVLGNIIDIIRQRLPGIVTRSRKKAQALSEESHNDDSSPPTTPTASSNSGAESLFDRPEVNPSSTTLDTDFELPAISLDQQTQPNQMCDFVNWNGNSDFIDFSAFEFGEMSHWDQDNNWGPLLEFSNG